MQEGTDIYPDETLKAILVAQYEPDGKRPVASFRIFPFGELSKVSHALRQLFPDHEGDFSSLIRAATKESPLRLPKRVRLP